VVDFLLELEIERELNLPCAGAGDGLHETCKRHGVHAEYRIDLCHIRMVEKIEKFLPIRLSLNND